MGFAGALQKASLEPTEAPPAAESAPAAPPAPPEVPEPPAPTPPPPDSAPPLPLADIAPLLAALREAKSRDDVVTLALRALSTVARRAAVFAVRKDSYRGWACTESFGSEAAFREVIIPHDQPSILAASTSLAVYLGPITDTPAHKPLTAVMGRASADVAVVAARVSARPAMILVADELSDTLVATRRMEELARAVGEALARLIGHRA
jgi:hypothetical protein